MPVYFHEDMFDEIQTSAGNWVKKKSPQYHAVMCGVQTSHVDTASEVYREGSEF